MKYLPLLFTLPLSLFALPDAPSNLELIPTTNSVTMRWNDNANTQTGYKIYRDNTLIYITKPHTSTYTDVDLQKNHVYTYTVKATDDSEVASAGTFFLQALSNDAHHVITDTSKNLMWVNEFEYNKHACLAVHGDRANDYETSKDFCALLHFADFDDWRDPNAEETSNFIIKTNEADIETGYLAPCKFLLAREAGTHTETAVASRFHPSQPLGKQQSYQPYQYNVGLRCVRDY